MDTNSSGDTKPTSNRLPGFEECIIVPLELFDKKKFCISTPTNPVVKIQQQHQEKPPSSSVMASATENTPSTDIEDTSTYEGMSSKEILVSEKMDNVPSDLKMKLYKQAKWREEIPKPPKTTTSSLSSKVTYNLDRENVKNLLESIPTYARSIVEKIIVHYIDKNEHIVSWDPETLNILVDNIVHADTNIVRILRYLTIDPFMHNVDYKSAPNGTKLFRKKLVEIGVPETWLNEDKNVAANNMEQKIKEDTPQKKDDNILYTKLPPLLEKEWKSYDEKTPTPFKFKKPHSPISDHTRQKSAKILRLQKKKTPPMKKWRSYTTDDEDTDDGEDTEDYSTM